LRVGGGDAKRFTVPTDPAGQVTVIHIVGRVKAAFHCPIVRQIQLSPGSVIELGVSRSAREARFGFQVGGHMRIVVYLLFG